MQENSKFNNIFNVSLMILSFFIILFFCLKDNNLINLLNSLPNLNLIWLILSFLSIFIFWAIDSNIMKLITQSAINGSYGLKNAFKTTMVGQYFSAITPFAVAGQPMQIVSMSRQGINSGTATSIIVRKFLIYQTTLTAYSLIVILLKYNFFKSHISGFMLLTLIGFLCQSGIVVLLLLFSVSERFTSKLINLFLWILYKIKIIKDYEKSGKKLNEQLKFYIENNKSMNTNLKLTLKLYFLTALQLTVLFSIPFLIYKAYFYKGFPYVNMVSAQAFVTMVASYTPLPGGSGISEGGFIVIFKMFFEDEVISQAMLLWRFITYYSCIIVGVFFAGLRGKKIKR